MIAACDTFRAAAVEQLGVWAERSGVHFIKAHTGADPASIAYDAAEAAIARETDYLLIDTAGRLHIDEELMTELQQAKDALNPAEVMFVADSLTGQDAVNSALSFSDKIGIDSIILTKLDADARGGAALSIVNVTGKPIKFIGIGEKYSDFQKFHPDRLASKILGMGDMLTLIEKTEKEFDEKQAKAFYNELQKWG